MIETMSKKGARRQVFVDLLKEPTWSETVAAHSGRYAPRPGGVNGAGEFFDPDGLLLHLVAEQVSPQDAQRMVDSGAQVLIETCGCGGEPGGCTPQWLTEAQLKSLIGGHAPRFTGAHSAPSWIDVWGNDVRTVLYAHGDVSWGDDRAGATTRG